MRIGLISEHASPIAAIGSVDSGGQNVYVAQVARWLARAGHQVDVFTRRDARGQGIQYLRPGVRVIHVPAGPARPIPKERLLRYMPEFARHLLRYCSATVYDVLHANFFMSGLAALHVKRAYGTPLVTTFHALGLVRRRYQGAQDGFPDERIAVERLLARESDLLVAECPQDAEDLMALYDAEPHRVCIIPCGFDPAEFGPTDRLQARVLLGLPADGFVVLQLGRLVPRKGADNVIRALALLRDTHHVQATLMIVGGDSDDPEEDRSPEMQRLRQSAEDLGVARQVIFTGRQPRARLRGYYGAADVFVTTPWYEPFGITPLEAMACGVPVVGSAVGGIQYTVQDGVTGYLVPPRDPAALAERLFHLFRHPSQRLALGRAGLRRVRARFTWERVVERLMLAYRAVIPRARRTVTREERSLELVS